MARRRIAKQAETRRLAPPTQKQLTIRYYLLNFRAALNTLILESGSLSFSGNVMVLSPFYTMCDCT